MRRSLLNKQILLKSLRQALVLFTLLILPSAAWGQWETQTFTFSGCTDNILYLIDSNDNTTSYSWNYQGAQQYQGASFQDNKIKINVSDNDGKSTLSPSVGYTFTTKKVTFNYSNLTVTGDSKIYVRAVNRTDTTTHYTDPLPMTSNGSLEIDLNEDGISSDDLKFLIFSNDNKAYSYDLTSITIIKIADYHISIGGVPLTGSNVNPETGAVTGMTGISFTPANTENETPATLTLNNANYGPSLKGIIWSGNGNLKIQYSGNNIINTRNGSELNAGSDDGYCILGKSSSILILSASNAASTLTLKPSTGGTPESNNSRAAISGFENVTLDSGWGMYYTDDYLAATATSLTAGKEVVICKGQPYGISVGGVPVTSANINDVLNDGGTVKFKLATLSPDGGQTPDTPATLTLDGATISGNIESSITPLTVYLIGNNTINAGESVAPFKYTGTDTGSLTFDSSNEDEGELTVDNAFNYSYSVYSVGGYEISNDMDEGASTTNYSYWIINSAKTNIYYNPHYGITVGSYEVTKKNKDMVTSLSGDDITYTPSTNTLNIPANKSFSDTEIKSHRAELNIKITGKCFIKAIKYDNTKTNEFGTFETKVLNIDRFSESTAGKNKLTINNGSEDPAISGFTTVSISENLHLDEPTSLEGSWDDYVGMVVISDEIFYDLWVGGVQVSSGNASDIFNTTEAKDYATASFDKTTNTLTLNGAQITPEVENCGIESKLEKLTVNIIGTNTISCAGQNDAAIKGTGSNSIIFTGEATSEIDITALNPISDITATYENGLGLTTVNSQTHYIEHLKTPGISSSSSEDGISVTLSRPYEDGNTDLNTKYENATLFYSITYASETDNVDATEYTAPFTMTKPGTVTAYLTPGEGRGQSDNETGKYYGYPDAPYTMGVGDEITPAIYPSIEEDDYIGLNGSASEDENIATFTYTDGVVKALATGTVTLTAILTGSDMSFTVLNPKESSEQSNYNYPVTFSVVVGENLNTIFAANQNFGTWYNTSDKTYKVPDGITAYIITGVDGDKVTIAETKVIPPNAPILMEKGENAKAFTYTEATDTDGSFPSGNILNYTTTDKEAVEASKLYVLYNGQFVKVTAGTKILANHCYLDLGGTSAGTRGFYNIGDGEGTTAIREVIYEGVNSEKLADGAWHDLQGRKFTTKPTKAGIYIRNGKKIVIK